MMTKVELAKLTTNFVVGTSAAHCVSTLVQNNVPPANTKEKVEVTVGSYVLGAIVADIAKTWTDKKIDTVVSWWNTNIKK